MFETEKQDFTGHMINWPMVNRDIGPITPKGKVNVSLSPARLILCDGAGIDREFLLKGRKCFKCGISDEEFGKQKDESEFEMKKHFARNGLMEKARLRFLEQSERYYKNAFDEKELIEEAWRHSDWKQEREFKEEWAKTHPIINEYRPNFEVDHIVAICNGGDEFNVENLQLLCLGCHKKNTREDLKKKREGEKD